MKFLVNSLTEIANLNAHCIELTQTFKDFSCNLIEFCFHGTAEYLNVSSSLNIKIIISFIGESV